MIRIVMENAGLAFWPALSLVIFGGACLGMVLWIYRSGSKDLYKNLASLALDEARPDLRNTGIRRV